MRLKIDNRFKGIGSHGNLSRKKYAKHEHVAIGGGRVRMMTQAEIWDIKCKVQKLIDDRSGPKLFRLEVEA
jgi:hypothetical protein